MNYDKYGPPWKKGVSPFPPPRVLTPEQLERQKFLQEVLRERTKPVISEEMLEKLKERHKNGTL